MTVRGYHHLVEFFEKHTDSKDALLAWFSKAKHANWESSQDIRKWFNSASFLGSNIVIFNIKGNKYRLEAKVSYKLQEVGIIWVGTHQEYDRRNKQLKR